MSPIYRKDSFFINPIPDNTDSVFGIFLITSSPRHLISFTYIRALNSKPYVSKNIFNYFYPLSVSADCM